VTPWGAMDLCRPMDLRGSLPAVEALSTRRGRSTTTPRAAAYRAPETTWTITTKDAGFTNGMLVRVPTLYCAGDRGLLELPGVAIIGSRKASPAGRERAGALARALAADGVVVVSGLAAGVDASAHRAAIDAGGRTIAVVGTPLETAYPPENAALQEEIYRRHLLVSPFPSGTKTIPKHFPERNRVMARMALATVIIEASDTSGSLHQVAESLEVGRPVFIARAVVDNPKVTWPQRFINKANVFLVDSPSDVLDRILR
jgi:DNA processing protein